MDAVKVGQLTNADVYVNDNLCIGRFSQIERPKVEYERVKHASLGMVAEYEAPSRQLKALTGKGESQWLDPEVSRLFYDPTVAVKLTLDGYTDIFGQEGLLIAAGFRVTWHMTLLVTSTGTSAIKFGSDFKGEFEYSLSRFVETNSNDTVALREIDVMNQINKANGKDVWPRY